jgi:hypothetical protein
MGGAENGHSARYPRQGSSVSLSSLHLSRPGSGSSQQHRGPSKAPPQASFARGFVASASERRLSQTPVEGGNVFADEGVNRADGMRRDGKEVGGGKLTDVKMRGSDRKDGDESDCKREDWKRWDLEEEKNGGEEESKEERLARSPFERAVVPGFTSHSTTTPASTSSVLGGGKPKPAESSSASFSLSRTSGVGSRSGSSRSLTTHPFPRDLLPPAFSLWAKGPAAATAAASTSLAGAVDASSATDVAAAMRMAALSFLLSPLPVTRPSTVLKCFVTISGPAVVGGAFFSPSPRSSGASFGSSSS